MRLHNPGSTSAKLYQIKYVHTFDVTTAVVTTNISNIQHLPLHSKIIYNLSVCPFLHIINYYQFSEQIK